MKKPTIYQIKTGYEALASMESREAHFFDRGTMKFFHETMSMMKVIKTDNPMVFGVRSRYHVHYFEATGDGYPFCYYRHLQTYDPLPKV